MMRDKKLIPIFQKLDNNNNLLPYKRLTFSYARSFCRSTFTMQPKLFAWPCPD